MPATSSFLVIILFLLISLSLCHPFFIHKSGTLYRFLASSPSTPSIVNLGLAGSQRLSIQSSLSAENQSIGPSGTRAAILQVIRGKRKKKKRERQKRYVHAALKTLLICRCLSAFPLSVLCNHPLLFLTLASFSFFLPFPPSNLSSPTSLSFPNLSIATFSPLHFLLLLLSSRPIRDPAFHPWEATTTALRLLTRPGVLAIIRSIQYLSYLSVFPWVTSVDRDSYRFFLDAIRANPRRRD